MDNIQYFTAEQEDFIDTMQNGDIGEEIFECVTDGSLPYEDFELVEHIINENTRGHRLTMQEAKNEEADIL